MTSPVISVEHLSKSYRLGQIGGGTLVADLNRWWARVQKQPDPSLKIGQAEQSHRIGEEIWALNDVSFTVQQGEALGIIGRNGAGKSTLLKVLSRVTAPTSGTVKVRGRIASLLEVGTGFHPELTGRENVFLNGAILGMSKTEVAHKFDEIVNFAEIEQFIDTPVKRYSSGMYVRLAFAVAAHLEPEILVVDEVLAVGDASFQQKCLGKMGEVAQGGRTVLFVSHNMGAITRLCPKSLLLEKGNIRSIGASLDLVELYLGGFSTSAPDGLLENRLVDIDFSLDEFAIYQDGVKKPYYGNAQSLEVVITYCINRRVRNLLLGFDMINSEGTVLFRSYDLETASLGYREIGTYRSIFTIPGRTLKPGKYSFEFLAGVHRSRWISKGRVYTNIIVIDVKENDVDYPGVLEAPGTWKVEYIQHQVNGEDG